MTRDRDIPWRRYAVLALLTAAALSLAVLAGLRFGNIGDRDASDQAIRHLHPAALVDVARSA
jgi:hypothetical protein